MRALLLAAGQSSRMGKHKALLRYGRNDTFLSHLVKLFTDVTGTMPVVVVNKHLHETRRFQKINHTVGMRVIINESPWLGRFSSVLAGLRGGPDGWPVFIHDVDRPLVKKSTLLKMAEIYFDSGYVLPQYKNMNGHPVLLGRKVVCDLLLQSPANKQLNEFLAGYKARVVAVDDEGVVVNINTKEDYDKWLNG